MALALSNKNKYPPIKPTTSNIVSNTSIDEMQIIDESGPHFHRSQNLVKLRQIQNSNYNYNKSDNNINNTLKLMIPTTSYSDTGKNLNTITTTTTKSPTTTVDKEQTFLQQLLSTNITHGIPIPKSQNSPSTSSGGSTDFAYSASPTIGGQAISPFFCGSLSSSPYSTTQPSNSYDQSINYTSLKTIGKTLSTPLPIRLPTTTIATNIGATAGAVAVNSQNLEKNDLCLNQIQQFSKTGINNRLTDNRLENVHPII